MALSQGCVAAGALPPTRSEVSTIAAAGAEGMQPGIRLATGAHIASGARSRTFSTDVGLGYVYERLEASTARNEMMGPRPAGQTRATPSTSAHHGPYVTVARRIAGRGSGRAWLGARGELLFTTHEDDWRPGLGATVRLDWEVFAPAEGIAADSDHRGFAVAGVYGAIATGVFAEAGYRRFPDGDKAFIAIAGVSLRLPLIAGFGVAFGK